MHKINDTLHARFDSAMYFKGAPVRKTTFRKEPWAEIIVMLGGLYQARLPKNRGGNPIEARTGDVVYWPENCPRTEEHPADAPTRCICLYFRWPHPPHPLPLKIRDRDGLLRSLADRILRVHTSLTRSPPLVCNALLTGLLGEYIHLAGQVPKTLVEQVVRYVEEHLSERTKLDDLARAIGLNKHHFIRQYKALTGRTPMQDVRRQKIHRAHGLLIVSPHRTLKDVAAKTGIRDEHQLSRLLKRYEQVSVRTLRQTLRSAKHTKID